MISPIEFEHCNYGTKAKINSPWKDSYLDLLLEKKVNALVLWNGKGQNVDFLNSLPDLKSLVLIDYSIKSITPIHVLTGLVNLQISTYCNTPIDFTCFPLLTECSLEWIDGSDSLFNSTALKKLHINGYPKTNSAVFSGLTNLRELTILNSNIDNIDGIVGLENLNELRFGNLKKMSSLEGVQKLHNLTRLSIEKCKRIESVDQVFQLHKLNYLAILDSGNICTLKGIESLTNLSKFFFFESTNIVDGDLSPLFKLKNLTGISFQNRRHYSNKREDFGKAYYSL